MKEVKEQDSTALKMNMNGTEDSDCSEGAEAGVAPEEKNASGEGTAPENQEKNISPEGLTEETETPLLSPEECIPVIEAMLFALGRPVSHREFERACGADAGTVNRALKELCSRRNTAQSGIRIRCLNGMYSMSSNPDCYDRLISFVANPQKPVLTEVAMETLAIVACRNPVTKPEIEKIRGVNSDHAVNRLVGYGLIEEVGRKDAPGRPALFAPTDEFYRRFDIAGRNDLPRIDAETEALIEAQVESEAGFEPEEKPET